MNRQRAVRNDATRLSTLLLCGLAACAAPQPRVPCTRLPGYDLELMPKGQAQARRMVNGTTKWYTPHMLTLRNRGDHAFPYVLEGSAPWLRVAGPAHGVLGGREGMGIELSIEPQTVPVTAGMHEGKLRVLNAVTFHCEFEVDVAWLVPVTGVGDPSDPVSWTGDDGIPAQRPFGK